MKSVQSGEGKECGQDESHRQSEVIASIIANDIAAIRENMCSIQGQEK